jgi:hypothetical protein
VRVGHHLNAHIGVHCQYIVNGIVVSGFLWSRWHQWSRFVHAELPLKLLLGKMAYKSVASAFGKLLSFVKDRLVEIECQILEQNIPLTVGVPTIRETEEDIKEDDGEDDDWDLDVVDLDEDSSGEGQDESYD